MVPAAVVLAGLAALRLAWLSRGWPLVHDAPLMHYIAWRILEGAAPYRDLFDMNFPGVYAAHLLLLLTLGPGDLAFRAFDLGILARSSAPVSGARCARPGRGAAWPRRRSSPSTTSRAVRGSPDSATSCSAAFSRGARRASWPRSSAPEDARIRRLGGAALALGAAVWVKPHAIVLVPALACWVWWACRGPARGRALAAVGLGWRCPAWRCSRGSAGPAASEHSWTSRSATCSRSTAGWGGTTSSTSSPCATTGRRCWPASRRGRASASPPSRGGGGGGSSASWPWASPTAPRTSGCRDEGGSTTSTRSRSSRRRWAAPGSGWRWRTAAACSA